MSGFISSIENFGRSILGSGANNVQTGVRTSAGSSGSVSASSEDSGFWSWVEGAGRNAMAAVLGDDESVGLAACSYEDGREIGPAFDPDQDGGVDLAPAPDSGLEVNPDSGQLEMPGDIFNEVLTAGESGFDFFQETPEIVLSSGYMEGSGLQDLTLAIELGTDSTLLAHMPVDNPATDEIEGCLDGLLNTEQLSDEEIAFQEDYNANLGDGEEPVYLGCDEPDYSTFVACPTDDANRVPVYLKSIRIEAFRVINGEYLPLEENSIYSDELTNIADLYDPTAPNALITPLGLTCGGEPQPVLVNIPPEFYADGKLAIRVSVVLVADARQAHGYEIDYRTGFKARVISR